LITVGSEILATRTNFGSVVTRSGDDAPGPSPVTLRLYVARSTPNSVRAEQNLSTALAAAGMSGIADSLEVIDVFSHGKRATTDGVIVTPTLICIDGGKRQMIVGDLTDSAQLQSLLEGLGCRDKREKP
jgi:hypothetical protein